MLKPEDIQTVIDEVVTRLVDQLDQKPRSSQETSKALHDRVITTEQVPTVDQPGREVIVRSDAVITPAAKDLFRERGLILRRDSVQESGRQGARLMGSLVMVDCDCELPAGVRSLRSDVNRFDCIVKASRETTRICEGGDRVVLVTPEPEVAVIALSRSPALRAVEVGSLEEPAVVERRCEATAANVIVVAAWDGSPWRLSGVIEVFLQKQYAAIPAWL